MKKILASLFVGFFLAVLSVYGADKALVSEAQALKAKGDYLGAAKVHPKKLCKAIYLWNAAASTVGHRDGNGDWAINEKLSDTVKASGLELLAQAQAELDTYSEQDGTENEGCKGVNPKEVQRLINAVKACIEGNCK